MQDQQKMWPQGVEAGLSRFERQSGHFVSCSGFLDGRAQSVGFATIHAKQTKGEASQRVDKRKKERETREGRKKKEKVVAS